MDLESSNHYRGRKRKTGSKGGRIRPIPSRCSCSPSYRICSCWNILRRRSPSSPRSTPWIIEKVANSGNLGLLPTAAASSSSSLGAVAMMFSLHPRVAYATSSCNNKFFRPPPSLLPSKSLSLVSLFGGDGKGSSGSVPGQDSRRGGCGGRSLGDLPLPCLPAPYPKDPPSNFDPMDKNSFMQNSLALSHFWTSNASFLQIVCSNKLKFSQNWWYMLYDLLKVFQFFWKV
jgi:hypothetical protein